MAYSNRPIRRSALVGPWGVGAIVPFPNDESLMIAGLDMWRYNNPKPFLIEDERLQKRLGVKELRWPPDFREQSADAENSFLKIPTVRFPTWLYCPWCGAMRKVTYYSEEKAPACDCYQWPTGRKCNPASRYKHKLVPERFVVVCPEGHIDDFPVAEWLHTGGVHTYKPASCHIRRSTGGASSSLTGVFYECTCGARKSLAGATRPGALEKIGYGCKGAKPWLGISVDESQPCSSSPNALRVILRGATNVWFPDTRSSIHIPTTSEVLSKKILGVVNEYFKYVSNHLLNGQIDRKTIETIADLDSIDDVELLYDAFTQKLKSHQGLSEALETMTEDEYRLSEYNVLIKSSGSDAEDFHSLNRPISKYDTVIGRYFKSISLVPKLCETRAFIGFSRLQPQEKPIAERKKMLRSGNENWLPAIQTYGEGIFFQFASAELESWAQNPGVQDRIKSLRRSYKESIFGKNSLGELRPEFVLIHTFAHLLINQLSFECGYGSSSIRERIYCEKTNNEFEMYGLLLYTASGDSDGSLGGLVRQGDPGRIEDTIVDAIKNALWCTSDPICIQSAGQGPESCNLAACHNCALLPETCCENGNRLLDRGIVVGTLEDHSIGFFSDLRK